MTLLGAGFNMGSSGDEPSNMNMSLDDMIANRRKAEPRRSARRALDDPKQVSNVDRSVATSRAKRDAAMRARRGLSDTKKASVMEIEREVEKQGKKSLLEKAKKAQQQKKRVTASTQLDPSEKAALRAERRKLARAAAKAKEEESGKKNNKKGNRNAGSVNFNNNKVAIMAPLGRPPSKKAVNAAVKAMEDKGFDIPDGYQMVISFAPTANVATGSGRGNQKPAAKKNPPNNNNNNNNRGGRGGGRGRK